MSSNFIEWVDHTYMQKNPGMEPRGKILPNITELHSSLVR